MISRPNDRITVAALKLTQTFKPSNLKHVTFASLSLSMHLYIVVPTKWHEQMKYQKDAVLVSFTVAFDCFKHQRAPWSYYNNQTPTSFYQTSIV